MEGEFASMSAIYEAVPDFVPRPVAWGSFTSDPNLHFFLCEFVEMSDELPEMHLFSAKVAEMHSKCISPNGKFGFPVKTYNGSLPQLQDWTDTWEECFANGLRHMLKMEEQARGPNKELHDLTSRLFNKVIPRLLRPLETKGRKITPSLRHGDLWYGNAGTRADTGEPIIFDAAAGYAHNECGEEQRPTSREDLTATR